MECLSPHLLSFIPLASGPFCNRKLITEDVCQNFATIVRCVNNINTSATCRRDVASKIKEQRSFACQLEDLQEVCTDAPALDIGEAIHMTTFSSKAVTRKKIESTSVSEDEAAFKVTGRGSVLQASMILLIIHKTMLTLVL
ncbi:uncharacterized protein LOC112568635 [Pomacea canaliculata]|uniref:uncharacterized protein LOC112568635 n=1 Tax=Pomacea canaliculata TaxID=400727 RepID=UPI000D732578|nr:uncharacterized protein LOC112568635 [Pomacea canaliculata]